MSVNVVIDGKVKDVECLCGRKGFVGGYADAGYGVFTGEVAGVSNGNYLLKHILVEYQSGVDVLKDSEEHVWLKNAKDFEKNGVAVGDKVRFQGELEIYRRKNGTYDLGIENVQFLEKISDYKLPDSEELLRQFARHTQCEICLMYEHCDGLNCLVF